MTVCVDCLSTLRARQQFEDDRQQLAQQYDRQIRQQQLINQIMSIRAAIEQRQQLLQVQAARLGLRVGSPPRLPLWRQTLFALGKTLKRVILYATEHLR